MLPNNYKDRIEINYRRRRTFYVRYLEDWSLTSDLSVLFRTIPALLRGGGL